MEGEADRSESRHLVELDLLRHLLRSDLRSSSYSGNDLSNPYSAEEGDITSPLTP